MQTNTAGDAFLFLSWRLNALLNGGTISFQFPSADFHLLTDVRAGGAGKCDPRRGRGCGMIVLGVSVRFGSS